MSIKQNMRTSVTKKWISQWIGDGHKIEKEENLKMEINQLCKEAYEIAKSKGWHDEPRETGTVLALIHSEVSEALEADRKGDEENFVEELADVCIRVFDLCGSKGIDLEKAILKKMETNRGRSYKHGGKAY
jgi:NTP pyrophosphatase (non-canonical NTP hydrolase)